MLNPTMEFDNLEGLMAFIVTTDEVPMEALSDDGLPIAASGVFSKGDAEAGREEEVKHNQILGAGELPTKAGATAPALINLCHRVAWCLMTRFSPHQWQMRLTGNYFR